MHSIFFGPSLLFFLFRCIRFSLQNFFITSFLVFLRRFVLGNSVPRSATRPCNSFLFFLHELGEKGQNNKQQRKFVPLFTNWASYTNSFYLFIKRMYTAGEKTRIAEESKESRFLLFFPHLFFPFFLAPEFFLLSGLGWVLGVVFFFDRKVSCWGQFFHFVQSRSLSSNHGFFFE